MNTVVFRDQATDDSESRVPCQNFRYFNQNYNINTCFRRCPHLFVKIFEEEVEGLADTGAGVSIISSVDLIHKLGLPVNKCNVTIRTADSTPYSCLGYVNVPFTYQSKTRIIPTIIVPEVSKKLILGMDFLNAFNFRLMIPPGQIEDEANQCNSIEIMIVEEYFGEDDRTVCFQIHPEPEEQQLGSHTEEDESLDMPTIELPKNSLKIPEDLDTEHQLSDVQKQELFEAVQNLPATAEGQLGRTKILEHSIELLPGSTPKKMASYRWSPVVEKVINEEVDRMLRLGVIEECTGPVDFLNPLLPVKKANGKWRICLDSRRLNSCTKRDDYPFPNMVGILQRIQRSTYFSVIDLSESYYQVGLDKSSTDKTAFRTNKGLYKFVVMPFGLTNAPATMARLMRKVLGSDLEPFVYVYLDDIIITSRSFEHHCQLIRIVAKRLKEAGLTINLQKSKFCQRQIRYLGYVLSESGLSMDAAKIEPIVNYAQPKSVKDVRRLLGLAGFYQKFIQNYSEITTPITNLLKKGRKQFSWTKEADLAFIKLKEALISAPILANPDFGLPFIIETDSSDVAIGAVLVQIQGGERRSIAYFSKKLSSTQRRYSATERECLAVLLSIENFKHFVEGSKFIIQTDAMSLTFLRTMSIESKSPRIARWALKLAKYDLSLQYKKGTENIPADALSRGVDVVDVFGLDPYVDGLKSQIERCPDKFKDFKIVEGRVYKFITNGSIADDPVFRWKYVVPLSERRETIKKVHEEAHLGYLKTLCKVRERFYWPRMSSDIKRFCYACEVCRESKTPNINVRPPCGKPKECSRPWEVVSLDFLGPYPRSKHGNVWVLVVSDFFSKFVLTQCMRTATAPAVCLFLETMVFTLFGAPSVLISDNAQVFKSSLFLKLLDKYQVTHWLLPVYHPAPNPTERVNRVIVTAIRCALNKQLSHKTWDESIPNIAMAIRTSVHESTGFSPYFLNFGRHMVSSGKEYDHLRNLAPNEDYDPTKMSEDMKKLYEVVRLNLHRAYERYSRPYNLRSNARHHFKQGDVVYRKNMHLSDKNKDYVGKFGNKFSKARIKERIGSNTYVLEDLLGHRIPGTYHGSFLQKA